jgi:hypothetical protein
MGLSAVLLAWYERQPTPGSSANLPALSRLASSYIITVRGSAYLERWSVLPEVLEPVRTHRGVLHRVLNVGVSKVCLD